jgi:hypothetical protein
VTNQMLSDDDLTRLLGEAADSYPVPGHGFLLQELTGEATPAVRKPRRVLKATAAVAAIAAGVLLVQSLGGSTISDKQKQVVAASGDADLTRSKFAPTAPTTSDVTTTAATGSTNYSSPPGAQQDSARIAAGSSKSLSGLAPVTAPESAAAPATAPGALTGTDSFADGAKIVKTGEIGLVVGDGKVSAVATKVEQIAETNRGYLSGGKTTEIGDDPTASISMRVPVNSFEKVVAQVRATIGGGVGKVESSSTSGQDVTAQFSDTAAQISSLSATKERFLTILTRANTIGEILSVQQRIDSVQIQIDRLKGQQKLLTEQASMGTLTVTVSEKPKAAAAAKPKQSGISKAFDRAQTGFSSGVESLIAKSGRALLALIIALFGLVVLRLGWRLARRRLV